MRTCGSRWKLHSLRLWVVSNYFVQLHLWFTAGQPLAGSTSLGLVLSVAAMTGFFWWLGRDYQQILAALRATSKVRGSHRRPWLQRCFARGLVHSSERAGFQLGLALLRRERTFRLQTYPLLAYPILFLWFGRNNDQPLLFGILFAHLGAMYLPLVSLFLRYSDTPEAAWLCERHRAMSIQRIWTGVQKAMIYSVVVPLTLCIAVILTLQLGWAGAIVAIMSGCLMVWVCLSSPSESVLPFSQGFTGAIDPGREIGRVYSDFLCRRGRRRPAVLGLAARTRSHAGCGCRCRDADLLVDATYAPRPSQWRRWASPGCNGSGSCCRDVASSVSSQDSTGGTRPFCVLWRACSVRTCAWLSAVNSLGTKRPKSCSDADLRVEN